MDIVIKLIQHLLDTEHSIDTIESIVNQLEIKRDRLLNLIAEKQCADYFQLLNPIDNRNQAKEKLALTLDLFCCTHYANTCKNASCSFLHLCPYNVRPMYKKCMNRECKLDHQVLDSVHNRKIIDSRQLSFLPATILLELTRASADPMRSFWVCTDNSKKDGCSKKRNCDKLHYCYYAVIDTCTKSHCQHAVNDACLAYFRRKQLNEQEHHDIFNAFKKALRQRKAQPINKTPNPPDESTNPKINNSDNHQQKCVANRQEHHSSSKSPRTTIHDDILTCNDDVPLPLPEHEQDIYLIDNYDKNQHKQIERDLSEQLQCPIELLTSKEIISAYKSNRFDSNIKSVYYYYPIEKPLDIFEIFRWQNDEQQEMKSLIVYANIQDAHDVAKQNFDNNQFCLLRFNVSESDSLHTNHLPGNRLKLNNSLAIRLDRMWIYVYHL